MNTENLKLCDRHIPFLHRHKLAEMDGCSMGGIRRAEARMPPQKLKNNIVFHCYYITCYYQIELGSQSSAECVTVGTDCLSLFLKRM